MQLADVADEDLLRLSLEGGSTRETAFMELVDRYERRVYGICHRFFGNHADAQDATQDTFLAIARRAGSFRGDSKLSTWIYRIAVNACKDRARARDRRPQTPVEDVGRSAEAAGTPLTAVDDYGLADIRGDVAAALQQLDETSRTLIILCAIEGRDYAEVAEVMDLPIGTVKSRVFRARAKLADLLAPVLEASEVPPAPRPADQRPTSTPPDERHPPRGPPAR